MNRLITPKRILIFALALCIAGAGYYFWKQRSSQAKVSLQTAQVERADITLNITATGRVQPIDQVEIGTEVSGTVSKIYADFNQAVRKGQILLELDKVRALSKVQQAQASYATAQNETDYQKINFERTQKLAQSGSATPADLETAQYKYNSAQNTLLRSQSDLDQARLDLANCTVRSPIDGVVLSRAVEVGQTVAASFSAPTLFIIARNLERMEVKADVDEADIGQVKTGQKVQFTVDAHPTDTFTGTVAEVRLSATITSNVVTYTVVIEAENPGNKLLPGMTATCSIVTQEATQVLTLPAKAFQFTPTLETPGYAPPSASDTTPHKAGKRQRDTESADSSSARALVWLVQKNGHLVPRPVRTGLSDGVLTEVTAGLAEGDSIATGVQTIDESEESSEASSPFMPKRNNRKTTGKTSSKSAGGPPPPQ